MSLSLSSYVPSCMTQRMCVKVLLTLIRLIDNRNFEMRKNGVKRIDKSHTHKYPNDWLRSSAQKISTLKNSHRNVHTCSCSATESFLSRRSLAMQLRPYIVVTQRRIKLQFIFKFFFSKIVSVLFTTTVWLEHSFTN